MRIAPLVLLSLAALAGCASTRVGQAARVASSITSHWVCSGTFVSGQDPDRSFAEMVRPLGGMNLVAGALAYRVDRDRREVTTTIAGHFETRAVHRDGLGCVVGQAAEPLDASGVRLEPLQPPDLPDIAAGTLDRRLDALLAGAIEPSAAHPHRRTKALLVLRDGKIIGERYAEGVTGDTPMLGFSMSKTAMNALVGVLVRQGRLRLDATGIFPAWADRADPRRAITVDHLLRQTPGLDLYQDNSGFDINSRILELERDKAAASTAARLEVPVGTRWRYTDTNFLMLSRLVRDASGGQAEDVLRLARRELFGPLGMRHVTIDFDQTGTPMGSTYVHASPRDWARFGQLYLDDGMAGGRRILPEGWVKYSTTPTLDTGYGAGLWTNRVPGKVPEWGVPWGLPSAPPDAFFARGFLGQFTVVIPSQRIVIVRMGSSHVRGDDIGETDRIVAGVLAAVGRPGGP